MSSSPVNPLESLTIPAPCAADWDSMSGNDQVRFCQHCNLSVHHLSSMTRIEAKRLVKKSQGRLCVRYYRRPDGKIQTATDRLRKSSRRASRIAAGAFSATLSLCAGVAAQTTPTTVPSALTLVQIASPRESARPDTESGPDAVLAGTVLDPQGAVIAGATITLIDAQTKHELIVHTNDEGSFQFQGLPSGRYALRIESPGFSTKEIASLPVRVDRQHRLELMLEVAVATAGGAMFASPIDALVSAAFRDDLGKVKELLAAGADVNLLDTETDSSALMEAVDNGNQEMVQVLLKAGADVNAMNQTGRTALMTLGEETTVEIIKFLIAAGAEVNWQAKDGNSPLLIAAMSENVNVLQALLDAGAKVNEKNEKGKTALMLAAEDNYVESVKALLAAGAEVNEKSDDGETALKLAQENDDAEIIGLLKAHGARE